MRCSGIPVESRHRKIRDKARGKQRGLLGRERSCRAGRLGMRACRGVVGPVPSFERAENVDGSAAPAPR